jgi:two-component system chemotaxis response regulator CheB
VEAWTEPAARDIVVIGASAGGVEALSTVVGSLPGDLPASVFIVLHLAPISTSVLPKILERAGDLRAVHARHGEAFAHSCIHVAPPDQHMRLVDGHIELDRGPRENGHRPAIDPMFRSAARLYGPRVIGVVLSGVLDDGAAGLFAIKRAGGVTLVQSPADALYPTMPIAAQEAVGGADLVGTARELAEAIVALTQEEPAVAAPSRRSEDESDEVRREVFRGGSEHPRPGQPSGFTCPECHGALWETEEGNLTRFRCRTGHEFSPESLVVSQADHVERALWAALRALEEKAAMLRRMSDRSRDQDHLATALRYDNRAVAILEEAKSIRALLANLDTAEEVDEPKVATS